MEKSQSLLNSPPTRSPGSPSHSQQYDQDINRPPTPPPYSGPSGSQAAPSASVPLSLAHLQQGKIPTYPGLPKLDYRLYSPPLFELSNDRSTIISKAEYLSKNANALASLIRAQASMPPKPQIKISAVSNGTVDFEIWINLMNLLIPDGDRQRLDYIRCVGEGELAYRGGVKAATSPHFGDSGLEEWCRKFTESTAGVKTFALNRVVANLDTGWIEGQLRSLIASLGYRGAVDITFTTTHSNVIVQNPDKVNQFFTSVTTLFSGKNKYEVIKAVWPFATAKNGEPGRRCVVQSEEVWWREWKDPIRFAITQKRRGWVTVEDKLESLMEGKRLTVQATNWNGESA